MKVGVLACEDSWVEADRDEEERPWPIVRGEGVVDDVPDDGPLLTTRREAPGRTDPGPVRSGLHAARIAGAAGAQQAKLNGLL
jgi:hypothetical protein